MKVSELSGTPLDYWVARAEGYDPEKEQVILHVDGTCRIAYHEDDDPDSRYNPSQSWMWGGPIIERAKIDLKSPPNIDAPDEHIDWAASVDDRSVSYTVEWYGETPLLAAMRAYVASKFGKEVGDVP